MKKQAHISNDSAAMGSSPLAVSRLPSVRNLAILLVLISIGIYANTLTNGYVLDDFAVVKENTFVQKGMSAIPDLLTTPYHSGYVKTSLSTPAVNDLYRPLSLVTFAIEQQFFGESPAISHFINVLLFACCVLLLFLFFNRLFEERKSTIAFMASLFFAVHPIHTEVVANIKSRDELLCFLFALSSLLLFIRYARSRKVHLLVAGGLLYFLSLLSKETSLSFLAVVPLVFFFYVNENKKRSTYISAAAALTGMIYLLIRHSVLKSHAADDISNLAFIDNALVGAPSFASRIATAILILGNYIRLLFIPHPLLSDYAYNSIPFADFSNIGVVAALCVYITLLILGIVRLIKKHKDPFTFGILFFLLTIAMFSNIFLLIGAAMAERFVFFASAGFCLAIAFLPALFTKVTSFAISLSSKTWFTYWPVCVIFAMLAISRNNDWKDNYTLFRTDAEKAPANARLQYSLGNEMLKTQYQTEHDPKAKKQVLLDAMTYFKASLFIYPGYAKAHADLGNAFFRLQQFDSAEVHEQQAVSLNPKDPVALSNLGGVYFVNKKYSLAIATIRKALVLNPSNVSIMNNLSLCYLELQHYDSSITISYGVLSIEQNNALAMENLVAAYKALGKTDSVQKYEALSAKPEVGRRTH